MIHHFFNDFIPRDEYSLHYSIVDDAIGSLLHLGVGALMAKIDLQSAFRMVPVPVVLLGIHWQPSRSGSGLPHQFAMALHWILQNKLLHASPHPIPG